MLRLGEQTRWGVISAIAYINGERYYFIRQPRMAKCAAAVAMMPACAVEIGS